MPATTTRAAKASTSARALRVATRDTPKGPARTPARKRASLPSLAKGQQGEVFYLDGMPCVRTAGSLPRVRTAPTSPPRQGDELLYRSAGAGPLVRDGLEPRSEPRSPPREGPAPRTPDTPREGPAYSPPYPYDVRQPRSAGAALRAAEDSKANQQGEAAAGAGPLVRDGLEPRSEPREGPGFAWSTPPILVKHPSVLSAGAVLRAAEDLKANQQGGASKSLDARGFMGKAVVLQQPLCRQKQCPWCALEAATPASTTVQARVVGP